jgi:hypothetical protein
MDYDGGIEVLPALTDPVPGSRPEGTRIISYRLSGFKYYITTEGERKTSGSIDIYVHNQEIEKIENGVLKGWDGEICHIGIEFDPGTSRYQNKTVIIYLKQESGTDGNIPDRKKDRKEKKGNSPDCPRWD